MKMNPPHYCLFRGKLEPDVAEVAPYLIGLLPGTHFTNWILGKNLGENRGIFAHCRHSLNEMRRHFRSLITVQNERGNPMIFRFYDPRVIRPFLPTCETEELKIFFGKVTDYFVEGEDKESLVNFSLQNDQLGSEIFYLN